MQTELILLTLLMSTPLTFFYDKTQAAITARINTPEPVTLR